MKYKFLVVVLLVMVVAASGRAQTKISGSGTCAKPDMEHSITVPDAPAQSFVVNQAKCTWTKPWEIAGVQNKTGVATAAIENRGSTGQLRGVYVDTMANGDKAIYHYEGSIPMKNNMAQPYKNRFMMTSGTGKMKGIKASGTCSITPVTDGSATFECEGTYTERPAKPAAKAEKKM